MTRRRLDIRRRDDREMDVGESKAAGVGVGAASRCFLRVAAAQRRLILAGRLRAPLQSMPRRVLAPGNGATDILRAENMP